MPKRYNREWRIKHGLWPIPPDDGSPEREAYLAKLKAVKRREKIREAGYDPDQKRVPTYLQDQYFGHEELLPSWLKSDGTPSDEYDSRFTCTGRGYALSNPWAIYHMTTWGFVLIAGERILHAAVDSHHFINPRSVPIQATIGIPYGHFAKIGPGLKLQSDPQESLARIRKWLFRPFRNPRFYSTNRALRSKWRVAERVSCLNTRFLSHGGKDFPQGEAVWIDDSPIGPADVYAKTVWPHEDGVSRSCMAWEGERHPNDLVLCMRGAGVQSIRADVHGNFPPMVMIGPVLLAPWGFLLEAADYFLEMTARDSAGFRRVLRELHEVNGPGKGRAVKEQFPANILAAMMLSGLGQGPADENGDVRSTWQYLLSKTNPDDPRPWKNPFYLMMEM